MPTVRPRWRGRVLQILSEDPRATVAVAPMPLRDCVTRLRDLLRSPAGVSPPLSKVLPQARQQTVAHASGILLVAIKFFQQHPILKRRADDEDGYRESRWDERPH